MFGNKELEAGMLALNVRLDNMHKDINRLPTKEDFRLLAEKISSVDSVVHELAGIMQEIKSELAEKSNTDSPFLTKEGLYNYRHRKPLLKEE